MLAGMQRSYDLELFLGNANSKSQTIERVLHVAQKSPFADRNDVIYLLDLGGTSDNFVKFTELPL